MSKIQKSVNKSKPGINKNPAASVANNILCQLAFDKSAQANIIFSAGSGKIIMANSAACKLLGYSKKGLLTKNRQAIFDIAESSFKKMLKQRTTDGQSIANVTAIKKSGKKIPAEITSALFTGKDGVEKSITSIADRSQHILQQKNIDTKNEKIVSDNIIQAKSKQNKIDVKKEKIVAANILLAQAKSDTRLADNNKWIKFIAEASYDVMWDWDIITGKIYAGDSIQEVFGYNVKDNTVSFDDFLDCLLPEEKKTVKKRIFKTLLPGNKSWNDNYHLKRFDGSVASTISRASIIRDEQGKAIRLIGATQDVSRLQELEKKLRSQISIHEEDSEKFLLAARLSFDVIWDWNLLTNEVFLGEGFEELFGYVIKDNKGNMITDWVNYLHPDDKEAVIKELQDNIKSTTTHWEHAYRVTRADGSIAKVYVRASIIRHADGKAYRMIGAMQDLSRQSELEKKLEEEISAKAAYEEKFNLIFNSSSDVLFDCDLFTNKVVISDAYEKKFGYKLSSNMTPADNWASHIHPDDKDAVTTDYFRMLASDATDWKVSYRFLRADNSVVNVLSSRIIMRDVNGKAYRMIGSMHDITNERVLEEKLKHEIKLKEKQIAEAAEDAKDTERSDIGKELHDNINQLLGASKMYIEMAKRGGKNSEMYLNRSSEYTLTAIEEIRKLTKGLRSDAIKNLGLCESIESLTEDIMEVNPVKICCVLDSFKEYSVNDKFKLNVFRILQEQLNNVLKHAGASEVNIRLSQNKQSVILTIADDGVGFDTSKKRQGIGIANIKDRATAYKGKADFVSQPSNGCVLTVTFPFTDAMIKRNLVKD